MEHVGYHRAISEELAVPEDRTISNCVYRTVSEAPICGHGSFELCLLNICVSLGVR